MFASRLAVAQQAKPVSTWTPLRIGVFRAMWIAVLVSNIGRWMQAVAPAAAVITALNSRATPDHLSRSRTLSGVNSIRYKHPSLPYGKGALVSSQLDRDPHKPVALVTGATSGSG